MNDQATPGSKPLNRLLRLAVVAGVEGAVRLHILRGDDLNARDAQGLTPLMIAAASNKANDLRLLWIRCAAQLLDALAMMRWASSAKGSLTRLDHRGRAW